MPKYKCNFCGAPKDSILGICPYCNNQGNNLIKFNSLFLRKNINPWIIRTKNQINNKVVKPGVAYLRKQKIIQRGKILLKNQKILSEKPTNWWDLYNIITNVFTHHSSRSHRTVREREGGIFKDVLKMSGYESKDSEVYIA